MHQAAWKGNTSLHTWYPFCVCVFLETNRLLLEFPVSLQTDTHEFAVSLQKWDMQQNVVLPHALKIVAQGPYPLCCCCSAAVVPSLLPRVLLDTCTGKAYIPPNHMSKDCHGL